VGDPFLNLGKRRLACAIVLASVLVFCAWWIVDRSEPRPQIYQNYPSKAGRTVWFTLTNPATVSYDYWILNEFKSNGIWNIYPPQQVMHWEDRKQIPPHQSVTISMTPPNRPEKWRVTANCMRTPGGPPTLATSVGNLLIAWNLSWVVEKLELYEKGVLVPGPEMQSEISSSGAGNP